MPLFFAADFSPQNPVLSGEEAHHALNVLRLGLGSVIDVTDGKGNKFRAEIQTINKQTCGLAILESAFSPAPPYAIHLAIAPTKNIDRMEWLVEKLTEVGIQTLSFVLCERSERKILNLERLQKIAISALKQSLQTHLPRLQPLQPLEHWLAQAPAWQGQKMIAYIEQPASTTLKQIILPQKSYTILIGPEGDFSPHEVEKAKTWGFQTVSLGANRLRTETAGLVACLQCLWANTT